MNDQTKTRKKLSLNKTTLRRLTDPSLGVTAGAFGVQEPIPTSSSLADFGVFCVEGVK